MRAERIVRHLGVRAPAAALARRGALLVEDALRTASLPGDGAALLLIRQLRLAPFRAASPPQTVARALAARCAALTVLAVRDDTDEAALAGATAVRFDDPLDAHLALATRIARGLRPQAWCWRLVVPAYRPDLACGAALRAVALSLATRPEAPVALPAWLAHIAAAHALPRLLAALSGDDAATLAACLRHRPGCDDAVLRTGHASGPLRDGAATASGSPAPAREAAARQRLSEAHRILIAAAADRTPQRRAGPAPLAGCRSGADRASDRDARGGSGAAVHAADIPIGPAAPPRTDAVPPPSPSAARSADHGAGQRAPRSDPSGTPTTRNALDAPAPTTAARRPPERARDTGVVGTAVIAGEASRAGGLLFVVPVLEHLGWPAFLDACPPAVRTDLPAQLLAGLLARLRIAPDDPAWRLGDAGGSPMSDHAAGGRPTPDRAMPAVTSISAAWLTATRRWLRRRAGIGLASLVCRPARLALTRTHADVWLALGHVDVRIRRAGLDLDPGWVAWLGRVVSFHYGDPPNGGP